MTITGLRKSFGGIAAVQGVDITVPKGRIVAIIGPNGSGKTTLFNLITGMIPADEGSVVVDGRELVGLRPDQVYAAGLSRTFQTLELFRPLSLEDHLLIGMQRRSRVGLLAACLGLPRVRREEASLREAVRGVFRRFEDRLTEDRWGDRADSLSYANRRRLEIARAVAAEPKVLLLDEPAAGMNPHERAELTAAIGALRDDGFTILLIEHHMELISSISDHVVALDQGRKIAEGTPREVLEHPRVVEAYLG